MKGRVFGSALADYFWLVLLSEKTKTMQKTICPHLHTHFKWWLFTCFFKNVQMSDSSHNCVFNMGQVLSVSLSHLKCFQKFILVYCSAIQLCPEAFWFARVDNAPGNYRWTDQQCQARKCPNQYWKDDIPWDLCSTVFCSCVADTVLDVVTKFSQFHTT